MVRSTGAPAAIAVVVALCNTLADSLTYHFGLLHTGGPSQELGAASGALLSGTGLEGNDASAVTGAIYGDACPFIGAHGHWLNGLLPPFDSADCAVAASGIVTRGLSGAIGYDNSRDFCNNRAKATVLDTVGGVGNIPSPTGTALYSIPATLQGAAMATLLHVADQYVAPAGHGLVSRVTAWAHASSVFYPLPPQAYIYESNGIAVVASQQRFLVIFVSVFLATFVVFVVAVYIPAVHAVNADIKQQVSGRHRGQ